MTKLVTVAMSLWKWPKLVTAQTKKSHTRNWPTDSYVNLKVQTAGMTPYRVSRRTTHIPVNSSWTPTRLFLACGCASINSCTILRIFWPKCGESEVTKTS